MVVRGKTPFIYLKDNDNYKKIILIQIPPLRSPVGSLGVAPAAKMINFSESAAIVRPNTHREMGLDGERWMLPATPTNLLERLPKLLQLGTKDGRPAVPTPP